MRRLDAASLGREPQGVRDGASRLDWNPRRDPADRLHGLWVLSRHEGHEKTGRRSTGSQSRLLRFVATMKPFHTLDDVDVKGKRVLLRVDLNVPMEGGRVTDATRLERVAPTITEIAERGGRVILLAHLGRPRGRDPKDSLKPVAAALAGIIKRPAAFADDCIGEVIARGLRHEERRYPVPGEHALPQGRGKQRSRLCRRVGKAR